MDLRIAAVTIAIACAVQGGAFAAVAEKKEAQATRADKKEAQGARADKKEAQAAREKPLLRCDHLADKAQMDCLAKARERILEARKKREAKGDPSKPAVTDEPKTKKSQ